MNSCTKCKSNYFLYSSSPSNCVNSNGCSNVADPYTAVPSCEFSCLNSNKPDINKLCASCDTSCLPANC